MTMFNYELKGKFSTPVCQSSRGEMSCAQHNIKLPCKLLIVITCLSSLTLETESIHHSALGDSPVAALFPMLTYTRVFPVDHLDLHLDPLWSLLAKSIECKYHGSRGFRTDMVHDFEFGPCRSNHSAPYFTIHSPSLSFANTNSTHTHMMTELQREGEITKKE